MKRRTLLAGLMALPAALVAGTAGPGEYVTPPGDEPLEFWHSPTKRWWNCGFDQLIPGDVFRKKKEPQRLFQVTRHTKEGEMLVTQWA